MMQIIESLKTKRNRESTYKNYYSIWKAFNKFIIRLDRMPASWEERVSLYCAYLVDGRAQSGTIRSYVSAIKHILQDDGYDWNNQKILLESITRSCRLTNDKVLTRLPISEKLLELLLFEVGQIFQTQPYLDLVYKTIMSIGYHGLLCIRELVVTNSTQCHAIRACNVHVAGNKERIHLVLYTSKTHGLESQPQKIRITSNSDISSSFPCRHFCPFKLIRNFMAVQGGFVEVDEPFFIFKTGTPVADTNVRAILKQSLVAFGLDPQMYGCHSWRIGKASDVLKQGKSRKMALECSILLFKELITIPFGGVQLHLSVISSFCTYRAQ